jgi:hypothetical protein
MALDNIPTLGPGSLNGNLDKVLVYKNGGSEVAVSLLTLTNSALSSSGLYLGANSTTSRLRVVSADTNGIVDLFQNGSVASPLHLTRYGGNVPINLNASGGTSTSPTPLGDNTAMSRLSTNTYNGTAFGTSARIEVVSEGIQSATNYGSNMRFFVTAENATSTSEVLSLLSSGNVQINESIVNDRGSKLFVKGSGSTAGTTSLLVQNSAGTQAFKVEDGGVVQIGLTSFITWTFSSNTLSSSQYAFIIGNNGSILTSGGASGGVHGNNNGGKVADSDIPIPQVASAVLEVSSTTRGFLKPRLTTAQKNAIATPAAGLEIYDTDLNRPCFYNGTSWITL